MGIRKRLLVRFVRIALQLFAAYDPTYLNVLIFFPLTGGCSEGLDAFRFFFEDTEFKIGHMCHTGQLGNPIIIHKEFCQSSIIGLNV